MLDIFKLIAVCLLVGSVPGWFIWVTIKDIQKIRKFNEACRNADNERAAKLQQRRKVAS
jgi:hypothetical protein